MENPGYYAAHQKKESCRDRPLKSSYNPIWS